jgi:hypothetical protein
MAFQSGLVTVLATPARIGRGHNTTLRRQLSIGESSLVSEGCVRLVAYGGQAGRG